MRLPQFSMVAPSALWGAILHKRTRKEEKRPVKIELSTIQKAAEEAYEGLAEGDYLDGAGLARDARKILGKAQFEANPFRAVSMLADVERELRLALIDGDIIDIDHSVEKVQYNLETFLEPVKRGGHGHP